MKINPVSVNFTGNVPKIKPKEVEEKLPDFFRDRELFNAEKDELTAGYYRYGIDDFALHVEKYDPMYDTMRCDDMDKFDAMV